MRRVLVYAIAIVMLGACGTENPTLGSLPRKAAAFSRNHAERMPTVDEVEGLYDELSPLFVELRDRDVPFAQSDTTLFCVESVRLHDISSACDVKARVVLRLTAALADTVSLRVYYKCVDGDGNALTRGMVLPLTGVRPTEAGDRAEGEALLHLATDGALLERFEQMVFIDRDDFNSVVSLMHAAQK